MILPRFALAITAALWMGLGPAQAADLPIHPVMICYLVPLPPGFIIKCPGAPSATVSRPFGLGGAASIGAFAAGAIIGTAAVLCAYDIWLKIEGYKNWDGTPKVAQVHPSHRGHHPAP
jgi:hypothetical protein